MFSTMLCGGAIALTACPYLSEVHADSDPLPDNEGEFLEIVVPESAKLGDTIRVSINGKILGESTVTPGKRLVFCHLDSVRIFKEHPNPCQSLKATLPNSDAIELTLQAGICRDTTWLERAKPGKSWQLDSTNTWVLSQPSPGFGMPGIERDIMNLLPKILHKELSDSGWILHFTAQGNPIEFSWKIKWTALGDSLGIVQQGTGYAGEKQVAIQPQNQIPWTRFLLQIEGDEFPEDNQVESLLFPQGSPPIRISEVAPNPPDPSPEWVEVVNQSPVALPVWSISACLPMGITDSTTLIYPGAHSLITDSRTELLQALPALSQSSILETKRAWSLINSADTVRLCLWGHQVDSLFWNKTKPLPNKNLSPGWQPPISLASFTPKLSTRIISFSGAPSELQIRFPEDETTWTLSIWDRNGTAVQKRKRIENKAFIWKPSRDLSLGPYRICLEPSSGTRIIKGVVLAP